MEIAIDPGAALSDYNEYLFWIYSIMFLFVIGFSIVVNAILLKFSRTLGIRDNTTTIIRWSSVSKPSLGGITFFIVFLITLTTYSLLIPVSDNYGNKWILCMVLVTALGFTMGLADDAYNTKPILKLAAQALCGAIMYLSGIYIQTTPWEWLNILLTIIWVIAIMNSINMIDNMDAIATSVSAGIVMILMLCVYFREGLDSFDFLILLGLLGSLLGFLFHNWHPSKMFMGDTGSQFLGVLLAYFGIKYFWNAVDVNQEVIQAKQFTMVLTGFGITLIDTAIVVINRLLKGKSPFVGGKDHTTHHLSYLGLSDSQVAMIFAGLSTISIFFAIIQIRIIDEWTHPITIAFWSYYFVVFLVLFYITRKVKYDDTGKKEDKKAD
jgi:UDP-GlcNAc:undecaprenyl-phosphate/decaprenyl-phosphate GlcNAc-1-phosphate transferase